jgi:CMP-N-acetylneuraminic acid synthetase
MKKIAIIPARGGSKSIPLKNIKHLNGKPLIEYTIETALLSNSFDKIIVSTDHDGIADVCSKYSEVDVFRRPSYLSLDQSTTESALIHVCNKLNMNNYYPDAVVVLEPTSPMRSVDTIKKCSCLLDNDNIDSVVGVVEVTSLYGKIIDNEFQLSNPNLSRRRQDREKVYQVCSTIFATKVPILREKNDVMGGSTAPLIVNMSEAIDINEEYDFLLAEAMIKIKNKK